MTETAPSKRTKREARNLTVRFTRVTGDGNVVLSFQNGKVAVDCVIGVVEACKVDTELGLLDAFQFCPAAGSALATKMLGGVRRKTLSEVKQDVNRAIFEMIVGVQPAPNDDDVTDS